MEWHMWHWVEVYRVIIWVWKDFNWKKLERIQKWLHFMMLLSKEQSTLQNQTLLKFLLSNLVQSRCLLNLVQLLSLLLHLPLLQLDQFSLVQSRCLLVNLVQLLSLLFPLTLLQLDQFSLVQYLFLLLNVIQFNLIITHFLLSSVTLLQIVRYHFLLLSILFFLLISNILQLLSPITFNINNSHLHRWAILQQYSNLIPICHSRRLLSSNQNQSHQTRKEIL